MEALFVSTGVVALAEMGVKTIMYNCNPETVSTDYDTSDILYFEPIDFEHVRSVIEKENPDGVIVHFGGQTPLKLANALTKAGAKIILPLLFVQPSKHLSFWFYQ